MTSISAQATGPLRARLLASAFAIAVTQAWSPGLGGDGFAPIDDPDSPYYRGEVAPPSWQGRPYAITDDVLPFLSSRRAQDGRGAE
jgi:gamma-glutamyltranspeptidase